ncbi:hypothetical protein ASPZODRAFT_1083071 [Penicilliopsis zonata CBS 506.65]|uniref:Vesicle tethering protein Uso1/P115-like head domain-containing protein n=1 Tax=Penicilliopsis zonata CBS 506.65 TaxID=1073090 RepID=A0A1L9SS90_9EURO|nr:hypothetical protein ASPZODRAFT_1083071 [Penicilliopsis zonata CBS 506.65]OJJ49984.1 hypothetical protein ASPZODRAFT_1083071 [Penicilliopsis zonata CBS 506.65]
MFRILESQAPAKQTATDTINVLSGRLQSATLLEDRRAAIQGLRSFAKIYPASVASGALRGLISSLQNDREDVDTIKVVLETLLMLFSPDEASPEASDEIALWLADEFTQRQDNITALLDLIETRDFYSRLYSLQLISHTCAARPERTQECILTAPLGITRLVSVLSDSREPIRNEALLLLIALTPTSEELQKLVAFENAFDLIFSLIEAEGSLTHGSDAVVDCLTLLANLLRLNISNQSYFRETGGIKRLAKLLADSNQEEETDQPPPSWMLAHRDKNIWGLLAIVQLFLVRGGLSTPINQTAFWQSGVLKQALRTAFSQRFTVNVISKALETCADLIRGNSPLQEKFGDIEVFWGSDHHEHAVNGDAKVHGAQRINVIEALLKLTLESAPIQLLDARLSACECMKAFFANHPGIREHVLRRAISGHLSGEDQIPNILSVLLVSPDSRGNADPYQTWLAAVLMFHLVFEDPAAKSIAMQVTEGDAESGEEVVTCVQTIVGNLITGMQRGDDERILIGYLMLLCGWVFEDPDVVNDLLGEGSSIQSLLQEVKHRSASKVLMSGLSTLLLGIIYEFSTKDSPIPRGTLHKLLMEQLGRDMFIDKITKLRESPLVRDFEVTPQTTAAQVDGGLPEIFFDKTFIDFLKDNFGRLTRAIDREPDLEISVITNGVEKGVSRELVDALRGEIEEKNQLVHRLESDFLHLKRQFDQEQVEHKKTKDTSAMELSKIQQTSQGLQRNHQLEFSKLEEQHKTVKNELLKQHGEQLRAIDKQLKQASADYERKTSRAAKTHEQHASEVATLKGAVYELETQLRSAQEKHEEQVTRQELEAAREGFLAEKTALEKRADQADAQAKSATQEKELQVHEARSELEKTKSATSEKDEALKALQDEVEKLKLEAKKNDEATRSALADLEKAKAEAAEKEEARKAAQSELEDLLIVFGDLEAKRNQDKERLKELGEEVSEAEDEDDDDEEEEEEDDDDDEE